MVLSNSELSCFNVDNFQRLATDGKKKKKALRNQLVLGLVGEKDTVKN